MIFQTSFWLGLLAASLHGVAAVDQVVDAQLVEATLEAPTRLERLKLYPSDNDTVFDFYEQPNYSREPGSVVNANRATFPYAAGNGMTMALLSLGPCSMLPPHFHPRAANFVMAINGTTDTYMVEENGARTVRATLDAGKATIFPAASIHTMENKGCEFTQLVSALNSEDTGTTNMANVLFQSLPHELVVAALGGRWSAADLNATAGSVPPVGFGSIYGRKECLDRCRRAGYKV
ncbi:uncharacterized protein BKCO1_3700045 [Diplodia corticola]|uniref:Cupin type-1 domain-containing protein n=1 Tax=Diplodia corticola TaxID=236234 RepID=A0A1J9QX42_9PEZI|nr:uncharacterized protein BKCO1_3700045 [Diplodia corticola]OJD32554.1 hypothetical protein BKCO1_3700045 [Diplodia corticola]